MDILKHFIVFEGLDGSGTTTQAKLLYDSLRAQETEAVLTCEPTDSPVGKLIRDVLAKRIEITPGSLALLYAADRDNHLYRKPDGVVNQLSEGKVVISDRYILSSIAYQSVQSPLDQVTAYNAYFPYPEIIVYIDTPVEECLRRIQERNGVQELFEHKEFLERVRWGYEQSLTRLPHGVQFFRVDGTRSPQQLHKEISQAVSLSY
ncbi:MAG: dTMP kinase [Spirochaetota bacterium]